MSIDKLACACALIISIILTIFCAPIGAYAWSDNGVIAGTEVAFSELTVSKKGVSVTLTNNSINPVKISSQLTFYDANGNKLATSIFGVREIESGAYVKIGENHLDGSWRKLKDAPRMVWTALTYELIYN